MSWTIILELLLQELAKQLPGLIDDLVAFVRAWLAKRAAANETLPTGTLEEFKSAVRAKLQAMIDGLRPGAIRLALTLINRRVTDAILDRVYNLVVAGVKPQFSTQSCPEDLLAACDDC